MQPLMKPITQIEKKIQFVIVRFSIQLLRIKYVQSKLMNTNERNELLVLFVFISG